MKAMILAAGRGKRMLSLTDNTPKPLLRINNETLIEYNIRKLKSAGVNEIIINTAYLGHEIENYLQDGSKFGVKIYYSREGKALETAGGIINALSLLGKNNFIVINSDIVTNYDIKNLKLAKNSLAHLVLIDNPKHNEQGDFNLNNGYVSIDDTNKLTFSGIAIYNPKLFDKFKKYNKLPLLPVFKYAIENKMLTGEYYSGFWSDIGNPKRLKNIISYLKKG